MPRISIVMRARDEEGGLLFQAFEALRAQRERDFEVVLVFSSLEGASRARLEETPSLLLLATPSSAYSSAGALNLGVSRCQGEYVVSLNADATPAGPDWLEELLAPFADRHVAGAYGRQLARSGASALTRWAHEATFPDGKGTTGPTEGFFSNVNSAFRRELWREHPFAEEAGIAEDLEWCKWALERGYQVVYQPRAAVYHSHDYTLRQLYRRNVQEGFSRQRIYGRRYTLARFLASYAKNAPRLAAHFAAQGSFRAALDAFWYQLAVAGGLYVGSRRSLQGRPLP